MTRVIRSGGVVAVGDSRAVVLPISANERYERESGVLLEVFDHGEDASIAMPWAAWDALIEEVEVIRRESDPPLREAEVDEWVAQGMPTADPAASGGRAFVSPLQVMADAFDRREATATITHIDTRRAESDIPAPENLPAPATAGARILAAAKALADHDYPETRWEEHDEHVRRGYMARGRSQIEKEVGKDGAKAKLIRDAADRLAERDGYRFEDLSEENRNHYLRQADIEVSS